MEWNEVNAIRQCVLCQFNLKAGEENNALDNLTASKHNSKKRDIKQNSNSSNTSAKKKTHEAARILKFKFKCYEERKFLLRNNQQRSLFCCCFLRDRKEGISFA